MFMDKFFLCACGALLLISLLLLTRLFKVKKFSEKFIVILVAGTNIVLLLLLLSPVTGDAPLGEGGKVFADVVMYISTFFSLVSCVDYIARNRDCLKDK